MDEVIKHILAIRGSVEIDQALRLLSKKLDMSLQTLYSEYNRAVRGQKRPSVSVSTSAQPSGSDYLVTYIIGLREGREIFLRECLFQEDILADSDMALVSQAVANTLDAEVQKTYELRFEEISGDKKEEVMLREFRELIHNNNKSYFRKLQKSYSKDLSKLQTLLTLAKEHHLI